MIALSIECAIDANFTVATDGSSKAGLRAGVFAMFLYITFYGGCIDATTYVYCTEIFPTHLRSYGISWSLSILFTVAIVYLEAAPTALAVIGWRYYLLFVCLSFINIFMVWKFLPETKGLSLEEIGEVFGDEVAVKLTHLTAAERERLDREIVAEKAGVRVEHLDTTTLDVESV